MFLRITTVQTYLFLFLCLRQSHQPKFELLINVSMFKSIATGISRISKLWLHCADQKLSTMVSRFAKRNLFRVFLVTKHLAIWILERALLSFAMSTRMTYSEYG